MIPDLVEYSLDCISLNFCGIYDSDFKSILIFRRMMCNCRQAAAMLLGIVLQYAVRLVDLKYLSSNACGAVRGFLSSCE